MRYAIIENGVVVNAAESDTALAGNWIASETAKIGQKYENWQFSDPVVVKSTAEIKADIAARRYQEETSGTTMNGIPVDTDRQSQALITGAALAATIDPAYICRWKTKGGFITLDAAAIIGVATAVRNHVQNCFNREAELIAAVEDGTYASDMIDTGWPQ